MEQKIIDLIEVVTDKTQSGKAIWNRTSSVNKFKIELNKEIYLTIEFYSDDVNNHVFEFNIFNARNESVHSEAIRRKTGFYESDLLEKLYKKARHSYFKVDETVDVIMEIISDDAVIGTEEKEEEDDGLPF